MNLPPTAQAPEQTHHYPQSQKVLLISLGLVVLASIVTGSVILGIHLGSMNSTPTAVQPAPNPAPERAAAADQTPETMPAAPEALPESRPAPTAAAAVPTTQPDDSNLPLPTYKHGRYVTELLTMKIGERHTVEVPEGATIVHVSPNGRRVMWLRKAGMDVVMGVAGDDPMEPTRYEGNGLLDSAFSADSSSWYAIAYSGLAQVLWRDGQRITSAPRITASFSPDGKHFAYATINGINVVVWKDDVKLGRYLRLNVFKMNSEDFPYPSHALHWSKKGGHLAYCAAIDDPRQGKLEILSKAVDDGRKNAAYPWCLRVPVFQRGKGYATCNRIRQTAVL